MTETTDIVAPPPDLPEDPLAREMLQDIALQLVAKPEDKYLDDFVAAAGQAMKADMVLVSRIKDKDQPVTSYAIFDRSDEMTYCEYVLEGSPCERVFKHSKPFVMFEGLHQEFPEDEDLVVLGLNAYAGLPLFDDDGSCFGLIAALWQKPQCEPEPILQVFRHLQNKLVRGIQHLDAQRERQQSLETNLETLSHRLDIALDASRIGVWDFDIESGDVIWDGRMHELYGVPVDGQSRRYEDWAGALHPADADAAIAAVNAAIENDAPFNSQFRIVLPDGEVRTIRAAGQIIGGAHNRRKMIGCNWDVTRDVELAKELEHQRTQAEQASEAKTRFLANMSHEIRTPLNGVLGMAQLLERTDLSERQQLYAHTIQSSGHALLELIDDILDISRIESGILALAHEDFNLGTLVLETLDTVRSVAASKSIELVLDLDPELDSTVTGDPKRLRQVILNLLGNAVKFTEAGRVVLSGRRLDDGQVRFEIRDSGPGISAEQSRTIFKRFAQIDASNTRQHGGTGLGLAICRDLVTLAGGEIGVDSELGKGSTFWFQQPLPRALSIDSKPAPAPEETCCGPGPNADGARHVLVVEDIETNCQVMTEFLRTTGYDTTIARNGEEALSALADTKFDAVLMDIQMPVMAGDEAIRRIRASGTAYADVPILAVTADATKGTRETLLALGATDYFTKPLDLNTLVGELNRILDSPQTRKRRLA